MAESEPSEAPSDPASTREHKRNLRSRLQHGTLSTLLTACCKNTGLCEESDAVLECDIKKVDTGGTNPCLLKLSRSTIEGAEPFVMSQSANFHHRVF